MLKKLAGLIGEFISNVECLQNIFCKHQIFEIFAHLRKAWSLKNLISLRNDGISFFFSLELYCFVFFSLDDNVEH